MTKLKEKAIAMLENSDTIVLTSINKEGYPRPVPMAKVASTGISTIWMATGAKSVKTISFKSNPKAGVCFYTAGNSVALTGDIEIVTDQELKQEYWQDWFIAHFPKGATDPDYVLLKFQSNHATFFIDNVFIHRIVK
jgi:general stress protein 26